MTTSSRNRSLVWFFLLIFLLSLPVYYLTAIMIFLALSASLVVLPSLLLLVTREKVTKKTRGKS